MQVQCPSCGKQLVVADGDAGRVVSCPGCGKEMQVPAAPVPLAAAPEAAGKRCPHCGEAVQAEAVKCRHCGEWIDPARRAAAAEGVKAWEEYRKGMRNLGIGLLILGGLAVVCTGVGFLLGGFDTAKRDRAEMVSILIVAAFFGAAYITLGTFTLKLHHWANWVVIAVASLALIINILGMIAQGGGARGIVPLLIAIALIATAAGNIKKHAAAKKADPD